MSTLRLGTTHGAAAGPVHCITYGDPLVLHCFPAHMTDLEQFHKDELDLVANQIRNGDITGRRVRTIRIVGHAATWRGLSAAEYRRRALARATAARDYIEDRIATFGLSYSPKFVLESRGDSEPLVDNMVASSGRTAKKNRAVNRRVELFLRGAKSKPKPKPKPDPEVDWDAFLNTKLRKLDDYWSKHRPLDGDRVHACIRGKLLKPGVRDGVVEPIPRLGAYRPPSNGPYVPVISLRNVLINDLKRGYATGKIATFDGRFDLHVSNVIEGVSALGFRAKGTDIYDKEMVDAWDQVNRSSEDARHLYSCPFFRSMIQEIED